MPKLSSKKILEIILPQLSTQEVKEDVIAIFGADQLDIEKVWKQWTNIKQWKRFSKCKNKSEQGNLEFIEFTELDSNIINECNIPAGPHFCFDQFGDSNQDLVTKIYIENKQGECWQRIFIPNNDLGDNFRLEVYTTPDDMEIIGWDVVVD